jgi:predicted O-linked N-acetylglucosamine transferase (SPINDLY family)
MSALTAAGPALLQEAIGLHQRGDIARAETLYRQLLRADERQPFLLHLLALAAYQRADYAAGVELARAALGLDESVPQFHVNLGNLLKAGGRLDEAITAHQRALVLDPGYADAHSNLGNALRAAERLGAAEAAYRSALALAPDDPTTECNLGVVLHEQGRPDEAAACFERALRRQPEDAAGWYNLGNARVALGDGRAAAAAYQRAVERDPHLADAWYNLGCAHRRLGKLTEAAAAFQSLLRLAPEHVPAIKQLGHVLATGEYLEEAIVCFRRALELAPGDATAYFGLGTALEARGRVTEAVDAYEMALSLEPEFVPAIHMKGNALFRQGQVGEAIRATERVVDLDGSRSTTFSNALVMANHYDGLGPEDLLFRHREYEGRFGRGLGAGVVHGNDRDAERRLRVGYVSPDLRLHSVAYFVEPVLAHHDHARFEVFCYHTNGLADAVSERLRAVADGWVQAEGLDEAALAERIRADRIDVLVDLAGHTAGGRPLVFARRPAPVQAAYLGYPTTTGLAAMGYRITDWEVDPAGYEAFNAEVPVRLPGSYFCYRPLASAPAVGPLPAGAGGPITFGTFNNFAKVSAAALALWAQVLAALPGSRLMIKAKSLADASVRERLLERFGAHGIGAERLVLRGWQVEVGGQLALYGEVDIGLDTYPYNGATTTCEALWMGVPVVTLCGRTHASRMGRSLLKAAGLGELVAETPEGYVQAVLTLAQDRERLAGLRAGLRERLRASALMDEPAHARALEAAYRHMWRQWCGS